MGNSIKLHLLGTWYSYFLQQLKYINVSFIQLHFLRTFKHYPLIDRRTFMYSYSWFQMCYFYTLKRLYLAFKISRYNRRAIQVPFYLQNINRQEQIFHSNNILSFRNSTGLQNAIKRVQFRFRLSACAAIYEQRLCLEIL